MELYFLSDKFLGLDIALKPRIPKNRANGEDNKTKRICVSNRIEDCIRLLPTFDFCQKKFVYRIRTKEPVGLDMESPKTKVPDWNIDQKNEIWLLKENDFEYIGMIESVQNFATIKWIEATEHSINKTNYIHDMIAMNERISVFLALEKGMKPVNGVSFVHFTRDMKKAFDATKHEYMVKHDWNERLNEMRNLQKM